MPTITIANFRTRFPEFSDGVEFPDSQIQFAIDDAADTMGAEANWCGRYERAQFLLTAHNLTLDSRAEIGDSGTVGQIASKSAGGVSVSYATGNPTNNMLMATVYGQRYAQLVKMCFPGVIVV